MPSRSGSTPIVWDDTIFLNVAVHPSQGELELWSVNRSPARCRGSGPSAAATTSSASRTCRRPRRSPTAAAVWVMTGTGILKAFDFAGTELWMRDIQKDYGRFGLQLGLRVVAAAARRRALRAGAARHADRRSVVPAADRQEDRPDGVAHRAARPQARQESPDAYTTPALAQVPARRPEIVITGGDVVTGHDPATGKELWRVRGLNPENRGDYRIVASPRGRRRAADRADAREPDARGASPGGRGDVTATARGVVLHARWSGRADAGQ